MQDLTLVASLMTGIGSLITVFVIVYQFNKSIKLDLEQRHRHNAHQIDVWIAVAKKSNDSEPGYAVILQNGSSTNIRNVRMSFDWDT